MGKKRWVSGSLKLRDDHKWKAKPGWNICVLDRGAVHFNFPEGWLLEEKDGAMSLHDKKPPDDNCCLGVSYMRLPPIDWSGLRLGDIVEDLGAKDERDVIERDTVVELKRGDMDVAWIELRYIDPDEKREARSRIGLARLANIQTLITFDYWETDIAKFAHIWDEVLNSLILGFYIKDPTKGPVVH